MQVQKMAVLSAVVFALSIALQFTTQAMAVAFQIYPGIQVQVLVSDVVLSEWGIAIQLTTHWRREGTQTVVALQTIPLQVWLVWFHV